MINPNDITTVRVGELIPGIFNLTDNIPHEKGETLTRGTVQEFIDFIIGYLGTSDSLAFNPTTVLDGGTLPVTDKNEWMLVGKGTFYNVGGGSTIVTSEELNALTSNGSYWSLAVQIPISAELIGIVQTIRSGYLATAPSENTVHNALLLKANIADIPPVSNVINQEDIYVATTTFSLPGNGRLTGVLCNGIGLRKADWTQGANQYTINFTPTPGDVFQPLGII